MAVVIKAELVKELRDKTSVSMMECKRALEQTNGDLNLAIDLLRKLGEATAVKKQSRVASEGLVTISANVAANKLAILEVNCETDFVAKNSILLDFANKVAALILDSEVTDLHNLSQHQLHDDTTVEQAKLMIVNQLGENIVLRRAEICIAKQGQVLGYYLHGNNPAKIASVICLEGGTEALARDIAMHAAAMRPEYLTMNDIPKEKYEQEQVIFIEQTKRDNKDKPEDILQKIVAGKVNKFFKEVTLLNQSFVKDPAVTIEQLVMNHKAKIINMLRIEIGEGIEKRGN